MAVHIKIPQPWDMPEHQITPEALYWNCSADVLCHGLDRAQHGRGTGGL